jgi:hypothetical protein
VQTSTKGLRTLVLLRYFITPLLILGLTTPALSQPHVIAQLGTSPLLGQVDSTQTLQADVARNERLFEEAGTKLGLSSSEYAQVRDRIATSRLTYVTIPRHLDAMTWSLNGQVKVLHDVIIPANTKGWEADIKENGQTVAVFIPNKCGNLSMIRRPAPVLAALPTHVKAAHSAPVAAVPPPQPAPASSAPTAAPVVEAPQSAPAPAGTPAPYTTIASNTAPAPATGGGGHFPWFLLLIPVIALVGGHGGGSVTTAGPPALNSGGPTPPPVSCPTPTPHK